MQTPLPPAIFSKHAKERIAQRLKISPEKLATLMKAGFGKKIGQASDASNLIHRLLWSPEDAGLLVVIQDLVTGTVLTVLTLEMYKRDFADNLSEKRVRHVTNQMVHAGHIPDSFWVAGDPQEQVTVHVHLVDQQHAIALGRWPEPVHSPDLTHLGKSPAFWTWVAHGIRARHHDVEKVVRVEARFAGGQNCEVPPPVVH